eukprot:1574670-Pleurochrysis_carterae.AAC.2
MLCSTARRIASTHSVSAASLSACGKNRRQKYATAAPLQTRRGAARYALRGWGRIGSAKKGKPFHARDAASRWVVRKALGVLRQNCDIEEVL